MKRLLLMRHAKSSWKDETLSDHQRPLARRGREAAERMGRLIAAERLVPDRIVTSTARRARRTAELVAAAAGFQGEIVATDALYHASAEEIWEIVLGFDPSDGTVLAVGHNPGMQQALYRFSGEYRGMVTATLAQLEFDVQQWSDIRLAPTARLAGLWRPKELEGGDQAPHSSVR